MFSDNLKHLRKENHITQTELAKAVGISSRTIQNYEAGKSIPKDKAVISKLSGFFNVPLETLFTAEDFYITVLGKEVRAETEEQYAALLKDVNALFSGGKLSADDRDAFIKAINDIHLETSSPYDAF